LFLWRRPLRSSLCATAACAGMLGAAVMTSTPMTWPEPAAPHVALRLGHVLRVTPHAHAFRVAPARVGHGAPVMAVSRRRPLVPSAPASQVCAPAGPGSKHRTGMPTIMIGSGGIYEDDGSGTQPIIETPPMSTDSEGCVRVG
jgi:hypothetical protein